MATEIRVPQLRSYRIGEGEVIEVPLPVDTTYFEIEVMAKDTSVYWSMEADQVDVENGHRRTLAGGAVFRLDNLRFDGNEVLYLSPPSGAAVIVEVVIAVRAIG